MRLFVFILFGSLINVALAASFDCTKAASATEKLICGNDDLSNLDEALHDAYAEALKLSPDKQKTRDAQRQWLKTTLAACNNVACLQQAYQKRLAELLSAGYPIIPPAPDASDGDVASPRETFLRVACSSATGSIAIENGITRDRLPVTVRPGKMSQRTEAALIKFGYHSVQTSSASGTCWLGQIKYQWDISFHGLKPDGECMAAENWTLNINSAGDAPSYTFLLDGEMCPPDLKMLKLLRLRQTVKGISSVVCASGQDTDNYDAIGKPVCETNPE